VTAVCTMRGSVNDQEGNFHQYRAAGARTLQPGHRRQRVRVLLRHLRRRERWHRARRGRRYRVGLRHTGHGASLPRRRFRRDELDPASTVLTPRFLQLPAPETIDLKTLLPPGSGWSLLTASAINSHGQITGAGRIGGEVRAYRLSPPGFGSPLRLLTVAELLIIIGGVAAGGGGFGITASGHIIPIPPREPGAATAERVREIVVTSLRDVAARAVTAGEQANFQEVLRP
jgi:hypothetical protein